MTIQDSDQTDPVPTGDGHYYLPDHFGIGAWRRYELYEIVEGYIRPAEGAAFEDYDPWEETLTDHTSERNIGAGYMSLVNLLLNDLLKQTNKNIFLKGYKVTEISDDEIITKSGERMILDWCQRFGLLGCLHTEFQLIRCAPRWRYDVTKSGEKELKPAYIQYARKTDTWTREVYFLHENIEEPTFDASNAVENDLLGENNLPDDLAFGYVMRTDPIFSDQFEMGSTPAFGRTTIEPASMHLGMYFPDVPREEYDTFAYPHPRSNEFWEMYAEPVYAFLLAAMTLSDAVIGMGGDQSWYEDQYGSNDHKAVSRGRLMLDQLLAPINPSILHLQNGHFTQRLVSPSLLSSFALMAAQDLTGGRPVRTCNICGTVFSSKRKEAVYCSAKCRNTGQKRRQRERRKSAD